jgi:hypothetical protein
LLRADADRSEGRFDAFLPSVLPSAPRRLAAIVPQRRQALPLQVWRGARRGSKSARTPGAAASPSTVRRMRRGPLAYLRCTDCCLCSTGRERHYAQRGSYGEWHCHDQRAELRRGGHVGDGLAHRGGRVRQQRVDVGDDGPMRAASLRRIG